MAVLEDPDHRRRASLTALSAFITQRPHRLQDAAGEEEQQDEGGERRSRPAASGRRSGDGALASTRMRRRAADQGRAAGGRRDRADGPRPVSAPVGPWSSAVTTSVARRPGAATGPRSPAPAGAPAAKVPARRVDAADARQPGQAAGVRAELAGLDRPGGDDDDLAGVAAVAKSLRRASPTCRLWRAGRQHPVVRRTEADAQQRARPASSRATTGSAESAGRRITGRARRPPQTGLGAADAAHAHGSRPAFDPGPKNGSRAGSTTSAPTAAMSDDADAGVGEGAQEVLREDEQRGQGDRHGGRGERDRAARGGDRARDRVVDARARCAAPRGTG